MSKWPISSYGSRAQPSFKVLHSDIATRTERRTEQLVSRARLYVANRSFQEAKALLRDHHLWIIAGPPGIGKTMLADMLLVDYIARDYEPVVISEDVSEADKSYRTSAKQVFVYDDFLGRTNLAEHFNKNEDSRLSQFMAQVHRTSGKRLILTTREYILAEARFRYDTLRSADVELFKIVLDLAKYSRLERARILYNHLYFAGLPQEALDSVSADRTYHRIILHSNYNPRLIEQVTRLAPLDSTQEETFADFMLRTLDDPSAALGSHLRDSAVSGGTGCSDRSGQLQRRRRARRSLPRVRGILAGKTRHGTRRF